MPDKLVSNVSAHGRPPDEEDLGVGSMRGALDNCFGSVLDASRQHFLEVLALATFVLLGRCAAKVFTKFTTSLSSHRAAALRLFPSLHGGARAPVATRAYTADFFNANMAQTATISIRRGTLPDGSHENSAGTDESPA